MNLTTLILLGFLVYFISIAAFFFLGMAIMKKQKDREIREYQARLKDRDLERKLQANSLRQIHLKYTTLKQNIKKLMKKYPLTSNTPVGKNLKEIINGKQ